MAITPPALATQAFCLNQLTLALGIAHANNPDGSQVAAASPYTQTDLKRRLALADYEINSWIIETLDHPYRTQFETDESDGLANGAAIPAHLGPYSRAMISGSPDTPAIRAQSIAHIEKVQASPALYGSPTNLYFVHAGRVYLGDTSKTIKFRTCNIEISSFDNPTLKAPQLYSWGVIANAVIACGNRGFDVPHREYWAQMLMKYEQMIRGKALSLPEPDRIARVGT